MLYYVHISGYRQKDGTLRLGERVFGEHWEDWPNKISINGSTIELEYVISRFHTKDAGDDEIGVYL
jgi:hypothetical protein